MATAMQEAMARAMVRATTEQQRQTMRALYHVTRPEARSQSMRQAARVSGIRGEVIES